MRGMSDLLTATRRVFRGSSDLAAGVCRLIERRAREIGQPVKIMNFCGTHEWTTVHYGLRFLLPPNVRLIAGPGCPVCVTPASCVDAAIRAAMEGNVVYTFGDAFRLMGSGSPSSLQEARAAGADVRVIYSFLDAVRDAGSHGRESVFLGIGFETTAPSYAILLEAGRVPDNLRIIPACRLTPPSMRHVMEFHLERGEIPVSGVIAPGHVSTVIGAAEWEFLPREYGVPVVVAGFEPLDVLLAVAKILQMLASGRPGMEIEYRRLVSREGNPMAKRAIAKVFEVSDAVWRGLGRIPASGLLLREEYREHELPPGDEGSGGVPDGCRCPDIIAGIAVPSDCPLFMRVCRPDRPLGPCMVSSEGACSIWAREGAGRPSRCAGGFPQGS